MKNGIVDHRVPGDDLNDSIAIYHDDRDSENGNASHAYELRIQSKREGEIPISNINFQHGPRNEAGSIAGVTDAAVVAVVLDRYRGFQSGEFACRENALVITKLEEALHWMQRRAISRYQQGVLGKNVQHEQPA